MRAVTALAFLLLAFVATSRTARADDYGPHKDIRAIRGAIPILLASRIRAYSLSPNAVQVDDVVVNGDEAVTRWSADGQAGLAGLARIYGTWWLTGEINQAGRSGTSGADYWQSGQAGGLPICGDVPPFGAATDNLIRTLHVTQQTADIAAAHIELVRNATTSEENYRPIPGNLVQYLGLQESCYQIPRTDGRQIIAKSGAANFLTTLLSAKSDTATVTRFTGRAPTAAEFPPSPGANAVYFFSFELGGATSAAVNNGSLDVWCPFVLDPEQRYSLTIDYVTPALGPIYGTLFDNTLHFDLPAFTVAPNTSAMGEIDFLPPRSY